MAEDARERAEETDEAPDAWREEDRESHAGASTRPSGDEGREARRPTDLTKRSWKQVLLRVWNGIAEDHLSIIAAGVGFFGMVAVAPSFAALIGIYGIFADPDAVAQNLERVRPILPGDAYSLLEGQVDRLLAAGTGSLGLASLIAIFFALWSSRAGVAALMEGLNIVYRERDTRNIVWQYASSLFLTVIVIALAILALVVVVALPAVMTFLHLDQLGIGALGAWLARVLPLLVLGVAVVFVIGVVYRMGPHRAPARKRWITPGAVIATITWVLASYLLSTYISRFGNFNETYGSLGAIIALLFWLYLSAFVVLLGAKLNAEMELETEHDTTTGPPRPMGRRGAYVADHVA
ncbi:YihY/virulence factor BrkB family protein [Amaricoccus solimangrovi]|uniref:YihY/virulence factor BrkB family protein n=1 Tax=Amaricoccus solimangrovi TaxID=2589815 RepID=A0A501WU86_9RHOB|nr:YihY/virulence factor BrkB family protein [Amaricoccus solimangrovi]TPE52978.1 YihY/virulence factor BrkB family protein [Amaricoccus solimangrovi]